MITAARGISATIAISSRTSFCMRRHCASGTRQDGSLRRDLRQRRNAIVGTIEISADQHEKPDLQMECGIVHIERRALGAEADAQRAGDEHDDGLNAELPIGGRERLDIEIGDAGLQQDDFVHQCREQARRSP